MQGKALLSSLVVGDCEGDTEGVVRSEPFVLLFFGGDTPKDEPVRTGLNRAASVVLAAETGEPIPREWKLPGESLQGEVTDAFIYPLGAGRGTEYGVPAVLRTVLNINFRFGARHLTLKGSISQLHREPLTNCKRRRSNP